MTQLPATRSGPGAIITFVAAVLVLSWLRFIPLLLEQAGVDTPAVVVDWILPDLGSFGPLIVALLLTARLLGFPGLGDVGAADADIQLGVRRCRLDHCGGGGAVRLGPLVAAAGAPWPITSATRAKLDHVHDQSPRHDRS